MAGRGGGGRPLKVGELRLSAAVRKPSSGTQRCKLEEALAESDGAAAADALALVAAGLWSGPFPPGHPGCGLPNPHPTGVLEVVACLAVYTGRSPRFLVNRSGKLSSTLLCQLILEDTALSLLGKANGGLCVCIFPDLLPQGTPCTDIVARPSFRTWEPVSTALLGLTPT